MQETAEWVSLTLTVPTILLALVVLQTYGKKCLPWVLENRQGLSLNLNRMQWLILGIACGFAGQAADNIFWLVAWTADYLDWPSREAIFQKGAWFNIVSRQTTGILAALCHLRSAYLAFHGSDAEDFNSPSDKKFYWTCFWGSLFVGALYGLALLSLKYGPSGIFLGLFK